MKSILVEKSNSHFCLNGYFQKQIAKNLEIGVLIPLFKRRQCLLYKAKILNALIGGSKSSPNFENIGNMRYFLFKKK